MRRLFWRTFFLALHCCLVNAAVVAQTTYHTIRKDTINISGYIYDNIGRPAAGLIIWSRARELTYNQYPLTTATDDNGHFVINGALVNDTLMIDHPAYQSLQYYNRGSRYMVVYLTPQVVDINTKTPLQITAVRTRKLNIPSFKVEDFDGCILFGFAMQPEFPGGNDRFINYIKKNLQYPEAAVAQNREGLVKVRFAVEKDGSVTEAKIVNGIGYDCDKALLNIIKQSPKWKPGTDAGRAVKTQAEVSVQFILTDK